MFESLQPGEMCKESALAISKIFLSHGNVVSAYKWLSLAEKKIGPVEIPASFMEELEAKIKAELKPMLALAAVAFEGNDFEGARRHAQSVLDIYPACSEARELVGMIETIALEEEVCGLWGAYEKSEVVESKLRILRRLKTIDGRRKVQIEALILLHETASRASAIGEKMNLLTSLAEQKLYREAADALMWLLHQDPQFLEGYEDVFTTVPAYSVWWQNPRLRRLQEHRLRHAWLTLVEVLERAETGDYKGSYDSLIRLRPFFQTCETFRGLYRNALLYEQEKATVEAERLLAVLSSRDCDVAALHKQNLIGSVRKRLHILPALERGKYEEQIESRLEDLNPATSEEQLVKIAKDALLVGNLRMAERLKRRLKNESDFEILYTEVKEKYRIDAVPVSITNSSTLEIDLSSQPSHCLKAIGGFGDTVIMTDGEEALLLVNPITLKATKFVHGCFSNLVYRDSLPGSDIHLFTDPANTVFKIDLNHVSPSIVGTFDLGGFADAGDYIFDVFMSGDRMGDLYYACQTDSDEHRIVGNKLVAVDTFHRKVKNCVVLKNNENEGFDVYKIGYAPDAFLIGSLDERYICDKTLKSESTELAGAVLSYDPSAQYTYFFDCHSLIAYDYKRKDFPFVINITSDEGWIYYEDVIGVNVSTEMALLSNNRISGEIYKFRSEEYLRSVDIRNILCTKIPSRFFYFQYKNGCISIREIDELKNSISVDSGIDDSFTYESLAD